EPIGVSPDSYVWYFALARPRVRSSTALSRSAVARPASTKAHPPRKKIPAKRYPVGFTETSKPLLVPLFHVRRALRLRSLAVTAGRDGRQLWMNVEVLFAAK